MNVKTDLRDLTYNRLAEYMEGLGLPASRARFVFAWLQRPGTRDFSQMVDVKKEIRATLAEHAVISHLVPAAVETVPGRHGEIRL